MTNFDFLQKDPQFEDFSKVAALAEQLLHIDSAASVLNCRRAMEFAIKWMYSQDSRLESAYDATLLDLMEESAFQNLVGEDIFRQLDFIRKLGNDAAHEEEPIPLEQAKRCLEYLFCFMDFVAHRYSACYVKQNFNPELLELTREEALSFVTKQNQNGRST